MPQIDLRQTFPAPKENVSPTATSVQFGQSNLAREQSERKGLINQLSAIHLSQSGWANIAFVVVTFVGGLFCALYFFNGAELFRAANAWHREFLYPRPRPAGQQAKIDRPGQTESQTVPLTVDDQSSSEPGGNPFRRNAGLLNANQPLGSSPRTQNTAGSPPAGSGSNPGSLLNQLNLLPPGGDSLFQTLNEGVGDVARASGATGRRSVAALRGTGSQAGQRLRSAKRNATSRAHNTLTNAKTQRPIQRPQNRSQRSQPATLRSTNSSTSRQTAGTLRGMTSRSMSGLGSVRGPVSIGGRR